MILILLLFSWFSWAIDQNLDYSIELKRGKSIAFDKVSPGRAVSKWGTISDNIQKRDGYWIVERTWKLNFKRRTKFRLPFRYYHQSQIDYWTIPSVVYNGNSFGQGAFPKPSLADHWSFREDRTSIPSCSIVETFDGNFESLFVSPAKNEKEISSVKVTEDYLEVMIPWEERPKRYLSKGVLPFTANWFPKTNYFKVKGKFEYKRTFYIVAGQEHVYRKTFEVAWDHLSPNKEGSPDWSRIASAKLKLLNDRHYFHDDEKGIYGLKRGLREKLGKRVHEFVEFSFLTKGMEGANIFWRAGEELSNDVLKERAIKMADYMCSLQREDGLFYTAVDYKKNKIGEGFYILKETKNFNTRAMGEVAYQMLELADRIESELPEKAKEYSQFAKNVATFFMDKKFAKGNFGQFLDPKGKVLSYGSSNGAYIIWVLAKLYQHERRDEYLELAQKSALFYLEKLRRRQYESDALDADATDKEFGQVLLHSFLMLHDLSDKEDQAWLFKGATLAAEYLLSWIFTYNIPFASSLPLGRENFKSFGGTAVSVAHHHLDVYGALIAYDFLKYAQIGGDKRFINYADALINFTSQLVALPENNFLGMPERYYGWQPEQLNQTTWNYLPYHLEGKRGTFANAIGWVPVTTLGALLEMREYFPEEMHFVLSNSN